MNDYDIPNEAPRTVKTSGGTVESFATRRAEGTLQAQNLGDPTLADLFAYIAPWAYAGTLLSTGSCHNGPPNRANGSETCEGWRQDGHTVGGRDHTDANRHDRLAGGRTVQL